MGYRATTSTLLAFGEQGACIGELVGEANQGLSYMFHMMNEARIGVGMGAVMLGYRGYLASLDYATTRPQGRAIGNKNPRTPQRPIIEHADVRRMLLAQKAYVEGGYALCLYCARLVDETKVGAGDTATTEAGLLLELLTPVAKSWPSQWCLEANSLGLQIHGGYGYTREFPLEQLYRDNRLNMIHEGTHGIQALAAQRGLRADAASDVDFYHGKISACRWFYRWELPKIRHWHELLRSLDDTTLAISTESF